MLHDLAGNPIHAYNLVERLVTHLPVIILELAKDDTKAVIAEKISHLMKGNEIPNKNDLEGVTQALVRIQFAYRLDPREMASGMIRDVQTEGRLSAHQMMNIAESRVSGHQPLRPGIGKEYALAIEWAEGALALVEDDGSNTEMEERIKRLLTETKLEHNQHWRSPVGQRGNYPNEEFFVRKVDQDKITTGQELRREEAAYLREYSITGYLRQGWNIHDFYSLCRGETVSHTMVTTKQYCQLTTKNNPYFYLAPLRQEIVSEDPLVQLYHDILTEGEIHFLTTKILDQLAAASVQDTNKYDGAGTKISNERTQSNGWLWDDLEDDILYKLSKKTGKLVDLETTRPEKELSDMIESEPLQLGLYGSGGHYLPHYDTFDPKQEPPDVWGKDGTWVGRRIATVMFYLNDLIGENTAFPKLGLSITPRKGTAVFWYNLDKNFRRDVLSLHGACPTALGIKWVANKWIREGAQIWKKPCAKKRSWRAWFQELVPS